MKQTRAIDIIHLLADQLRHFGVTVAESIHGDAGREVEISPIFNVPQITTLAFHHHGRWTDVSCNHVGHMITNNGGGLRIGRWVMIGKSSLLLLHRFNNDLIKDLAIAFLPERHDSNFGPESRSGLPLQRQAEPENLCDLTVGEHCRVE